MNIIRPGVYRPKNNLKDSKIDGLLIVIGENDNKENYFDCKNRVTPIHEDDLINNYVYFGPGVEPSDKDKSKFKKMIKNLGNFDEQISAKVDTTNNITESKVNHVIHDNTDKSNNVDKTQIHVNSHDTHDNFAINKILNKSKIDKPQHKTITIKTNYDIDKVMLLCETFDINFNSIVNKVIDFNNSTMEMVDSHDSIDKTNVNENNELIDIHKKLDLLIEHVTTEDVNEIELIENINKVDNTQDNHVNTELTKTIEEIKSIRKSLNNVK